MSRAERKLMRLAGQQVKKFQSVCTSILDYRPDNQTETVTVEGAGEFLPEALIPATCFRTLCWTDELYARSLVLQLQLRQSSLWLTGEMG